MVNDFRLENIVRKQSTTIEMLYTIQNNASEKTFLECFNHNQNVLRHMNYNHVANCFISQLAEYHEYRMKEPITQNKRYYHV